VRSVRLQQKQYLISFKEYGLQCSVVLLHICLFVFPSLPQSFHVVCIRKFSLMEVIETSCYWLHNFFDLAALIYTMSKRAVTLNWVRAHDPNFGEEVLGYLQEGFSDDESESECTIESDPQHRMC
jgi:hypothetical protein